MNDDLISRSALKEELLKRILFPAIVANVSGYAPAADTVEVVRCKDCKYLMFSDFYEECGQAHMGIVKPDDYCSYGERKE